jgi:hypothetical protein
MYKIVYDNFLALLAIVESTTLWNKARSVAWWTHHHNVGFAETMDLCLYLDLHTPAHLKLIDNAGQVSQADVKLGVKMMFCNSHIMKVLSLYSTSVILIIDHG